MPIPGDGTERSGISRRRLLEDGGRLAAGACLAAVGLGLIAGRAPVLAVAALRPPGALPEADFLGACVRCGQCVEACPYDTLSLADLSGPAASGTPFFVARAIPCEMCDDIPCTRACPTGALDPALTDIDKAKMGTAVLVGTETCLNFNGLRCDVCYRVCPVIDRAITLETQHNTRTGKHAVFVPTVHSEHCTGCGKCEKSCVLEEAAIKVLPVALAAGKAGAHYRLGWEEKAAHGNKPLVPGLIDLPDRLPSLPVPEVPR